MRGEMTRKDAQLFFDWLVWLMLADIEQQPNTTAR
jgi:hypothetical protein